MRIVASHIYQDMVFANSPRMWYFGAKEWLSIIKSVDDGDLPIVVVIVPILRPCRIDTTVSSFVHPAEFESSKVGTWLVVECLEKFGARYGPSIAVCGCGHWVILVLFDGHALGRFFTKDIDFGKDTTIVDGESRISGNKINILFQGRHGEKDGRARCYRLGVVWCDVSIFS